MSFAINIYDKYSNKINNWENSNSKRKKVMYYFLYTILFITLSIGIFYPFYKTNKSFIWSYDGINQHVQAVQYFGEYLRKIIKTFFSTGKLVFPMWDLKIGIGLDLISSLNYYSVGDPLDLLYVFVPSRYTEYFYNFLVILRLYLAGIAFSLYSFKMKNKRYSTLIGTFVYIFCSYALYASVRHPFFINPMIFFPIILLGIEKIFNNEKPILFICIIAISAATSFYFLYTSTILAVLYAMLRFLFINKNNFLKNLFATISKFALYYIGGIGLSSFLFIPAVLAVLKSSRSGVVQDHNYLFYGAKYYINFITRFMSNETVGKWNYLGYISISVICIIAMFLLKRKKDLQYKIAFILLTIFALIPFMGYMFNGFGYVTNRWIYVYSFCVAYITTSQIPTIFDLDKKTYMRLSCLTILYTVVCISLRNTRTEYYMESFIFLLVFLIIILSAKLGFENKYKRECIIVFMCIQIIFNAWNLYDTDSQNYVNEFIPSGTVNQTIQNYSMNAEKEISKLNDNTIFRTEVINSRVHNYGLTQDVNSINSYFSILNNYMLDYSKELGNAGLDGSARISSYDNRTVLNSLASVKYEFSNDKSLYKMPYGYEKVKEYKLKNGDKAYLYKNEYYLPIGYTYSSYIYEDEYKKLSANEKEQSLLQGAVVDKEIDLNKSDVSFDYEVVLNKEQIINTIKEQYGDNSEESPIEISDNKIIVKKQGASISLNFNGVDNSETYMLFDGLKFVSINPKNFKSYILGKDYTKEQEKEFNKKYRCWSESDSSKIDFQTDNGRRSYSLLAENNFWYTGMDDLMINLGYSENRINGLTIKFNKIGDYYFDDLKVICQPMDGYSDKILDLKEDVLENVKIDNNTVKGDIELQKNKLLCISIPYSSGWKAKVNDVSVDIIRTNGMYMGIMLNSGYNKVELEYCTPGIKVGGAISIISWMVFLIYCMYAYKKNLKFV